MKLFLKAACVAFILTVVYSLIPFQATCADISDEVFRLHILANSDSEADQALKLQVRDAVLQYTDDLYGQAPTKEDAERLTATHLASIAAAAAQAVRANGYAYSVRAELTRMPFATRTYRNYTLPSGTYDALRITLGKGEGHNWWCVMFPSLCVNTDAEGDRKTRERLGENGYQLITEEKQEYKFFIVELFEQLRGVFSQQS